MSNAMCIQLTYINMHTNIYFPREQETMLQLVPSFISQADHTVSCEYRAKLQRRCGKELWKEERWKCGANVNAQWARALTHTLGFHSKSVLTQGGPSLMGEHRFSCGWSQKCPPPHDHMAVCSHRTTPSQMGDHESSCGWPENCLPPHDHKSICTVHICLYFHVAPRSSVLGCDMDSVSRRSVSAIWGDSQH